MRKTKLDIKWPSRKRGNKTEIKRDLTGGDQGGPGLSRRSDQKSGMLTLCIKLKI